LVIPDKIIGMDYPVQLTSHLREHLRALRKARGLTQAALGRLLGVGQARIAEIESNPGAVSVDQLMKVLSALRASLLLRDDAIDVPANRPEAEPSPPSPAANKPREPVKQPSVANRNPDATPTSGRNFVIRPKKGSW